jgi:hypothetical protein
VQRVGRGSYLPLFLIFILFHITISQRFKLRGSFLPQRPRSRPSGTLSLPPCLLLFIVGMIDLPPCDILR